MLKQFDRYEPFIFITLLLLWLLPILNNDYFVTGDGPCHLYNSRLLLDWWTSRNRDFFLHFYFINENIDPNLIFSLITTPLLAVFSPITTEKIFFGVYVVTFCAGFRYLIGQINPSARFLAHLGLLFCYHRLLMAGFLNNSMSLAVWFWVAGWWWKNKDQSGLRMLIIGTLWFLLLYTTHPMGYTYALMTIGGLLAGAFALDMRQSTVGAAWATAWHRGKKLLPMTLPSLILSVQFVLRRSWSQDTREHDINATLNGIGHASSLRTMDSSERDLAFAVAITCAVFLFMAIYQRLKARTWHPADGLLVFIGLVVATTLFPPSSFSGGLEVPMRMGMIPFFAFLMWSATARFADWAKWLASITALVLVVGFLYVRLPFYERASAYAAEVRTCANFIHDRSTLLALNYSWGGILPNGQPINNGAWLFNHVDCYLGTDRTMAISDNYEANYWYFPINSRGETRMYNNTAQDGVDFDHRPPRANILDYNRRTGQYIDYVLMLCYTDADKNHPYTQEIMAQLAQGYDKIFTSEQGRAVLYKAKP